MAITQYHLEFVKGGRAADKLTLARPVGTVSLVLWSKISKSIRPSFLHKSSEKDEIFNSQASTDKLQTKTDYLPDSAREHWKAEWRVRKRAEFYFSDVFGNSGVLGGKLAKLTVWADFWTEREWIKEQSWVNYDLQKWIMHWWEETKGNKTPTWVRAWVIHEFSLPSRALKTLTPYFSPSYDWFCYADPDPVFWWLLVPKTVWISKTRSALFSLKRLDDSLLLSITESNLKLFCCPFFPFSEKPVCEQVKSMPFHCLPF